MLALKVKYEFSKKQSMTVFQEVEFFKQIPRAITIEMTAVCNVHLYAHKAIRVHIQRVSLMQRDFASRNFLRSL